MHQHHRVLIVGTVPYDINYSSRAFDAYFHNWEKEKLHQIFSNPNNPKKGHCGELFQITDHMLLNRWLHKKTDLGKIFYYDHLTDQECSNTVQSGKFISKLYKLGSKKNALNHLLRKVLWRKKYWNTAKLQNWLDEFKPECVFLAFSDDFFINEIALYVADRYNIPVMCCIGDDYFFNDMKSNSFFYKIYRTCYKNLIRRIFAHRCSAIYISDKIRDKYNSEFNIRGKTVYLTSDLQRREFRYVNTERPVISYCGNVRLGRNKSLADIGNALQAINSDYHIDVYTAEQNEEYLKPLKTNKGIHWMGGIPYSQVKKVFADSDIVIIVEGFDSQDINFTRYSLSTKAADSITSGCQILTYGSNECGIIEYMRSTGCSVVCSSKTELAEGLLRIINDKVMQKRLYKQSEIIMKENHCLENSNKISEDLFQNLIGDLPS